MPQEDLIESYGKDNEYLKSGLAWLAWSITFGCLVNLVLFLAMRSGLPESMSYVAILCFFFAVFCVFIPFVAPWSYLNKNQLIISFFLPFVVFVALVSPIIIDLLSLPFLIVLFLYVPVISLSIYRSIRCMRIFKIWQLGMTFIVGSFVGGTFFLWTNTPTNNVYLPEMVQMGIGLHDTMFNVSISTMLAQYGISSQGLDGLLPFHYHYGSHYWVAAISKICATLPIFVYPALQQIIMYPLILFSIGLAILLLSRINFTTILLAVILPYSIINIIEHIGYWMHRAVESYTISIVLLCLIVPVLVKFRDIKKFPVFQQTIILVVLVFCFFVFCSVKVSAGYLFGMSIGYLALRTYGINICSIVFITMLALASFLTLDMFLITNYQMHQNNELKGILDYLYKYYRFIHVVVSYPRWYMILILPLFYIVLTLGFWRIRNIKEREIVTWDRSSSVLSVELTILFLFSGILTGLSVFHKDFIYFSEPSCWFVISLTAVTLIKYSNNGDRVMRIIASVVTSLIIVIGLSSFFTNIQFLIVNLSRTIETLEARVLTGNLVKHNFRDGAGEITHKELAVISDHFGNYFSGNFFWTVSFVEKIKASPSYHICEVLEKNTNFDTMVYVPPSNLSFWNSNVRYNSFASLSIPSRIGVPMLKGLPPSELHQRKFIGQDTYPLDSETTVMKNNEIIQRARSLGFNKTFVFNGFESSMKNYVLESKFQ